MRQYVKQRKWKLVLQVEEVGSGSKQRPKRDELLKAARRREVDAIVVWKLDRWGGPFPT
jgi:putative DNA-invertase from lambdoid prophage Rac